MNSECDDSNGEQNNVGRQGVEVQERGKEDSSSSHNLNDVIDKKGEDKEIRNQICNGLVRNFPEDWSSHTATAALTGRCRGCR